MDVQKTMEFLLDHRVAHAVEIAELRDMVKELSSQVTHLGGEVTDLSGVVTHLSGLVKEMIGGINGLVVVAESHERRLSRLEGNGT